MNNGHVLYMIATLVQTVAWVWIFQFVWRWKSLLELSLKSREQECEFKQRRIDALEAKLECMRLTQFKQSARDIKTDSNGRTIFTMPSVEVFKHE